MPFGARRLISMSVGGAWLMQPAKPVDEELEP